MHIQSRSFTHSPGCLLTRWLHTLSLSVALVISMLFDGSGMAWHGCVTVPLNWKLNELNEVNEAESTGKMMIIKLFAFNWNAWLRVIYKISLNYTIKSNRWTKSAHCVHNTPSPNCCCSQSNRIFVDWHDISERTPRASLACTQSCNAAAADVTTTIIIITSGGVCTATDIFFALSHVYLNKYNNYI